MPTRFLNRIPIVASPKFLLGDVFGPSEAAAAKLSLANLRDLLRQPRESSASLGRNPLFSTQSFPMPRATLVLAVAARRIKPNSPAPTASPSTAMAHFTSPTATTTAF